MHTQLESAYRNGKQKSGCEKDYLKPAHVEEKLQYGNPRDIVVLVKTVNPLAGVEVLVAYQTYREV